MRNLQTSANIIIIFDIVTIIVIVMFAFQRNHDSPQRGEDSERCKICQRCPKVCFCQISTNHLTKRQNMSAFPQSACWMLMLELGILLPLLMKMLLITSLWIWIIAKWNLATVWTSNTNKVASKGLVKVLQLNYPDNSGITHVYNQQCPLQCAWEQPGSPPPPT